MVLSGDSLKPFFCRIFVFCLLIFTFQYTQASVSALETTVEGDSRIWYSAFSFASMDGGPTQQGGARLGTYNYLSLNYSTEFGQHWSFRVPFRYDSAGFDDFNDNEVQSQELNLWDFLVDYTVSSTLLPGDIEIFQRVRLELPTSDVSRAQKKIASLRYTAFASRYLTKGVQLEYWPDFTWNIHTVTTYTNEFGTTSHTRQYELKQRLTLWYTVSPKLQLGIYTGTQDDWFNRSNANSTSRQAEGRLSEHAWILGPSFRYTPNRNFSFLFSLQNTVPLWGFRSQDTGSVSDIGQFKPDQTQFLLLTNINI